MKPIYNLVVLLLLTAILGCSQPVSRDSSADVSLMPEQITELRQEYPLSTDYPELVEVQDLTFREVLEHADSVVIAEVVRQMPEVSVEPVIRPGTPESKLAEKQQAMGGAPYRLTLSAFEAKVDEVITGEAVEDTIFLFHNVQVKRMEPRLKPGMKIVTAIQQGTGNIPEHYYSYTRYATYYVVEDSYVLTAFEGESEEMKSFTLRTNGKSLENLLAEIRKLDRE